MPEVSRFFGIVIRMYYNDHNPPHCHALYGTDEALIGIDPVVVLRGRLPARATGLVVEWATLNRDALLANWDHLRAAQAPNRIPPLT